MYKKSNKGWLKHFDFLVIDIISLEVSYFIAYMMRHGIFSRLTSQRMYFRMIFVLFLIDFVSMAILRTFSGVIRRGYFEESLATLKQAIIVTLLSTFYLFTVQEGGSYSRITLILTGIIYFFVSYVTRCGWKIFLKNRRFARSRSLIIITTDDDALKMIRNFRKYNYSFATLTGIAFMDKSRVGEEIEGIPVIADRDSIVDYMMANWVDEALLGIPLERELRYQLQQDLIEMGITVHQSLLEVENESPTERNVERIGGYTVITRSIRILTTAELIMKRMLDIAGGLVGCLITGLLFLFVAPAIYAASPGPIFFSQDRIGKNGKVFKIYKFRSMYLDAEERLAELMEQNKMENNLMFKLDYDPRIIGSEKGKGKGIGNFIRRTSIDEFPQFWCVLTGDMSLCGTRPPLINEWEQYEKHHRARMATKPGITGMWQVSGRSNITDFEEVVALDMEYIENWSFGLDIKILMKTVVQVLKREGAE